MYLSTARGSLADFCCEEWTVTFEVDCDNENLSATGQTVCRNGSTFDGGNNYYIVSDTEYSYQGESSFTYWRINASGVIQSSGTFTNCDDCTGSGGNTGGGGNEF